MASTYLTNTNPTAGNRTKGTISVWLKRSAISSNQWIYTERYDSNNYGGMRFNSNDSLGFFSYDGGNAQADINTNRKFRDTNSWYHIVVAWDTTDGTASDRVKIYINGVRETSFSGSPTYPSSSQNIYFGVGSSSYPIRIGTFASSEYFDGSMSHFHRVDNQALAPTVFGSTDSTTGEWKINTSPSITYTGSSSFNFFILKDTNSGTDQSGQSNNLTVGGGTLTKTEDCPSNVFATWNILDSHYFWGATESSWATNGNTKARSGNSQYSSNTATMGASSGKYYWEIKITARTTGDYFHLGIKSKQDSNTSTALGVKSTDYCYKSFNGQSMSNNSSSAYGSTYTIGDIIGVAMDLDNNKLYFHKNGTYQNSGVPTSGSTGTGAISLTDPADTEFGFYMPAWSFNDGSGYGTIEANFGNGYFGTTAVSSAGTNASGNGVFEYDVPTGYTALSTKGLNT